ncbi:MAG TPA: sterol desaturase family protein, partial [Cytophagales bacterium]|nr:sterol desaturase family protein [Cytophagales bacterium]
FREGFIHFNFKAQTYWIIIDFCLLVIIMDLLMYIFHYLIHKLKFVHRIHDLHHLYTCPTPVSLYVLHPVEVLGFGALWLSLLTSMHFSLYAVVLYLIFNVLMGILGHMQVSILPETFRHHMVLRWLATTRFHRGHHSYSQSNYGFYTSIWDRLFGTWKD